MSLPHLEPATICYSLDKGWPDCLKVCQRTWSDTLLATKRYFAKYDFDDAWASVPFRVGGATAVFLCGSTMCLLGLCLQSLFVGTWALLRLSLTGVMWVIEWAWRLYWKVFAICDDCGQSCTLPAYICACGTLHRALVPNHHGIFTHRCTVCGEVLRSSMFSGRNRHAACCPYDGFPLTNYGLTPVVVGFAGGPSSGKTHLLYRSLATLSHVSAPELGWSLDWQLGDEQRFLALRAQYEQEAIRSTANELPVALRLRLQSKARVDRLLRVYDPGGEAFQEQDSINAHSYYQRIAGVCFVIDPFSQESVRRALGLGADIIKQVRPADDLVQRWFERLLEVPGISRPNSQSNVALALVISKMDAGQLLTHVRERHPGVSDNEAGRNFLTDHGLGSILSQADSHFRHVMVFFSGDTPQSGFDPAAPLLWIINHAEAGMIGVAARLKG